MTTYGNIDYDGRESFTVDKGNDDGELNVTGSLSAILGETLFVTRDANNDVQFSGRAQWQFGGAGLGGSLAFPLSIF